MRGHDANHLTRDAVDDDLAADHGTIAAETLLPPALHQNHCWRTPWRIVSFRKPASQRRLDTEHGQDFGSYIETLRFFHLGESPDAAGLRSVHSDALERSSLFAVGEIKERRRIGIGAGNTGTRGIQINLIIRRLLRR